MSGGCDGRSPLVKISRYEIDAELDEIAHGTKASAVALGGLLVVALIGAAFISQAGDFALADPPAVMTGAPAPAPNIPRLDIVTTAGDAITAAGNTAPRGPQEAISSRGK